MSMTSLQTSGSHVGGTAPGAVASRLVPLVGSKSRLTSTQLQLLLEAAARKDGAIVFPNRFRGRIIRQTAGALLERGVAVEIVAKPGVKAWRNDEADAFALVLTSAGRKAVRDFNKTQPLASSSPSEPALAASRDSEQVQELQTGRRRPAPGAPAASRAIQGSLPRDGSKIANVLALLQRPEGVNMVELVRETGWLVHTTRAALTGLRKRGHVIERRQSDDGAIWRIVTSEPSI